MGAVDSQNLYNQFLQTVLASELYEANKGAMSEIQATEASSSLSLESQNDAIAVAGSSGGRVSGKSWKYKKTPAVYVLSSSYVSRLIEKMSRRSNLPEGVKSAFSARMEKTKKEQAIKKLQTELREEKQAERTRYACDIVVSH